MSVFINWFIDHLSSEDVIDLSFVLSDMVDIDLTEEERVETAYFDALATKANSESAGRDRGIPIGKRVR